MLRLNMRKVELELITYPDMYMLFEKGTRGGIFYIFNRYSRANNKYLKSYDPKKESKYIIHIDANNLYGIFQQVTLLMDRSKRV